MAQARWPIQIKQIRMLLQDCEKKIVELMLQSLGKRIIDTGLILEVTTPAKLLLAEKGYSPRYGARPLRRVIQSRVEDKLSEALLDGVIKPGDIARVTVRDAEILVTNGEEKKT